VEFTLVEEDGEIPFEEWLIPALKAFAEKEYGLQIKVWIEKKKEPAKETED
jgi:hypothetical protein